MQRYLRQKYDIAIVIPNFLHFPTGGDREVSSLCKRLIADGFQVAIVYLKDPVRRLLKFVNEQTLTEYLHKRPLAHRIYYRLMGSKFGYRVVSPILRRSFSIDFKEQYEGASVLFLKDLAGLKAQVAQFAREAWLI